MRFYSMTPERSHAYRVSIHGHSIESDGQMDVDAIVEEAGSLGLDFIGLTDHETMLGARRLPAAVASYNERHPYNLLVAVPGIELRVNDFGRHTDMLVALPFTDDKRHADFIHWTRWASLHADKLSAESLAKDAVAYHDAMVVIPHPDLPLAGSMSFSRMRGFCLKAPDWVRSHVGIEVWNHSQQLVLPLNPLRPFFLSRAIRDLPVARFYFTDFHSRRMLAAGGSKFFGTERSSGELMRAVSERRIEPMYSNPDGSLRDWFHLFITYARQWQPYGKIKGRNHLRMQAFQDPIPVERRKTPGPR